MASRRATWLLAAIPALLASAAWQPAAAAEDLVLYGAGSLRQAMAEVAADFGKARGLEVRAEFGPSGLMRERIEKGERVDVFTSADMGHPLKLRAEGRATQVAMFTRNALCGMASPAVGLTPATFVDKLLDPAVGLGTSTPGADPSGDYTWAVFRRVDGLRPGGFATLDAKAQKLVGGSMGGSGSGPDPMLAAFRDGRVSMFIGYCSGADQRRKDLPDLQVVEVPDAIGASPEYGVAVLKDARPGAAELALHILSPEGQAVLAKYGFKPVGMQAGGGG